MDRGIGCAIDYPFLYKSHDNSAEVHASSASAVLTWSSWRRTSRDGFYGRKGLVNEDLKKLNEEGNQYDEIFAIGPMVMMKFVSMTSKADVYTGDDTVTGAATFILAIGADKTAAKAINTNLNKK